MRRLAASATLAALLACSGLGVCWRQFAGARHHCCAGGEDTAPSRFKPCASAVAKQSSPEVLLPSVAVLPVQLDPARPAACPLAARPILPVKSSPLILRI